MEIDCTYLELEDRENERMFFSIMVDKLQGISNLVIINEFGGLAMKEFKGEGFWCGFADFSIEI